MSTAIKPAEFRKGDVVRVRDHRSSNTLYYLIEGDEPVVPPSDKGSCIWDSTRIVNYNDPERRAYWKTTWRHFWYGAKVMELVEREGEG